MTYATTTSRGILRENGPVTVDLAPHASLLAELGSMLDERYTQDDLRDASVQAEALETVLDEAVGLDSLLIQARDAVYSTGVTVLRAAPCQSASMMVVLTSILGPVVKGRTDMDLVDELKPAVEFTEKTPVGYSLEPIDLHTDCSTNSRQPDYLILGCVFNTDPTGGGESILAHVDDVIDYIDGKAGKETTQLLFDEVYPSLNLPRDIGKVPTATSILFHRRDGRIGVRYRSKGLRDGSAARTKTIEPSPAHVMALGVFEEAIHSTDVQVSLRLETGDILLNDNSLVLHGRTAIGPSAVRHMRRLYAGNLTRLAPTPMVGSSR